MNHTEPFVFYTERRLVALTGLRARNLAELLHHLREIPGSSIFYHTHHMFLAHHFETPVFTNDFALWVSEALQEGKLGEKLAAIDLLSFTSIRDMRDEIVTVVEKHIQSGHRERDCPAGDEFYFCRSKSFVMPTGLTAADPGAFFRVLGEAANTSLFFHLFESRLRNHRPENDFSLWLESRGEKRLARSIERMNPYTMTLDDFKERLIGLGKENAN